MSFKGDMSTIKILEMRMERSGNRYNALMEFLEKGIATEGQLARMIEIEVLQDDLNARMHRILRKYKCYYHPNYYIVEDPDGGEYFRYDGAA